MGDEFFERTLVYSEKPPYICRRNTVDVAQSVRVVVCGTIGRGFESHLPPQEKPMMQVVRIWAFLL